MKKIFFVVLLLFLTPAFAWDSTGHRLIAQIAYDRLTPTAKQNIDAISKSLDGKYPPWKRFLYDSVWPDLIKGQRGSAYRHWHFIDLPYSMDGTYGPPPLSQNLIWAIHLSEKYLQDPKTSQHKKAIFLRFLVHFVGDAHQPLHCINRYTKEFPRGDKSGLRVKIQDPYEDNLHGYWDEGVGLFRPYGKRYPLTNREILPLVRKITRDYPESFFGAKVQNTNPEAWAQESFELAKNFAYNIRENSVPSVTYNQQGQKIVEQQIALAGYRLANLLNKIFEE